MVAAAYDDGTHIIICITCHFGRLHVVIFGSYLAPRLPSRRPAGKALAVRFDDILGGTA